MSEKSPVPTFTSFFLPTLRVLDRLGGSGTIDEINSAVVKEMNLSSEAMEYEHIRHRGTPNAINTGRTEAEYRQAWARTYLKRAGLLENSTRGVWSLTEAASLGSKLTEAEIYERARFAMGGSSASSSDADWSGELAPENVDANQEPVELGWEDELLEVLQSMDSSAFERLTQRLLREAGFSEVFVTGRSGDGGIDGHGFLQLNDLVGFKAYFQCKRYRGKVGPGDIRQFRGSMHGPNDVGIFVTTGKFTDGALEEARRPGSALNLIDGTKLVHLLKKLGLGVQTRETVHISPLFFHDFGKKP